MSDNRKQILVVDDQRDIAVQIGAYLKHMGFVPAIFTSVEEALSDFDPSRYLMVISDILMPGKNGFDLVRFIRNEHPQIPVALISGYFDNGMEDQRKALGIPKIYRKPLFISSIKQMLIECLGPQVQVS